MRFSLFTTGRSFFWVQLIRFGALLLASLGVAQLCKDPDGVTAWESWYLAVTTFSFFWIVGALDGLIPVFQTSAPESRAPLLGLVFRIGMLFSIPVAVAVAFFTPVGELSPSLRPAFALIALFNFPVFYIFYQEYLLGRGIHLVLTAIIWFSAFLGCLLIPLSLGYSIEWSFWLLAGAEIALFIYVLSILPLSSKADRKKVSGAWKQMAIPLSMATLVGGISFYLAGNLAREWYRGTEFLQYTYGAKELPIVLLIANAVSAIHSGGIASALKEPNSVSPFASLRKSVGKWSLLLFPVTIVLLIFSEPIFNALLPEKYAGAWQIFDLYLLLIIPRLLFSQTILRAFKDSRPLFVSATIELLICVILIYPLSALWGIKGIAAATIIAFASEKLINVIMVWIRHRVSPTAYIHPFWMLGSLVLAAGTAIKMYWFW